MGIFVVTVLRAPPPTLKLTCTGIMYIAVRRRQLVIVGICFAIIIFGTPVREPIRGAGPPFIRQRAALGHRVRRWGKTLTVRHPVALIPVTQLTVFINIRSRLLGLVLWQGKVVRLILPGMARRGVLLVTGVKNR